MLLNTTIWLWHVGGQKTARCVRNKYPPNIRNIIISSSSLRKVSKGSTLRQVSYRVVLQVFKMRAYNNRKLKPTKKILFCNECLRLQVSFKNLVVYSCSHPHDLQHDHLVHQGLLPKNSISSRPSMHLYSLPSAIPCPFSLSALLRSEVTFYEESYEQYCQRCQVQHVKQDSKGLAARIDTWNVRYSV